MNRQIKWNEKTNETLLITKFDDGRILCEPITSTEAAELAEELV